MAQLIIAPTITVTDPNRYKTLIEAYHPFTKRAQVDISDGTLEGAALTIPETAVWWPKGWTIDLHMMVARPSEHIPTIMKLMPNLVIFHVEAEEDLAPIITGLQKSNIRTGIAIMKPTYPGTIKHLIEISDHAMVFSGTLGQNGGNADLLQLEKIRIIKRIKPNIETGWDGGVNLKNIRTIAQAGVNVINVGGALATAPDPAKMYAALSAEAEKQGVV